MDRRWLMGALAPCMLLVTNNANAQALGASGDAIFAGERLFGVRGERAKFDRDGTLGDGEIESTTISFGAANPLLAHNVPRLAFDYLVIDKLSLGGFLAYSSSDVDITGSGGPVGLSGETTTFVFGGRVGYLHMLGRVVGIWPRGGLVFRETSVDDAYEIADLGMNLEFALPIVVAPHFGFLPALTYDQSFTGKVDPPGNDDTYDHSYRSIALQFGLFGWI